MASNVTAAPTRESLLPTEPEVRCVSCMMHHPVPGIWNGHRNGKESCEPIGEPETLWGVESRRKMQPSRVPPPNATDVFLNAEQSPLRSVVGDVAAAAAHPQLSTRVVVLQMIIDRFVP